MILACDVETHGSLVHIGYGAGAQRHAAFSFNLGVMADDHGVFRGMIRLRVGSAQDDAVVAASHFVVVTAEDNALRSCHCVLHAVHVDVAAVFHGVLETADVVVLRDIARSAGNGVVDTRHHGLQTVVHLVAATEDAYGAGAIAFPDDIPQRSGELFNRNLLRTFFHFIL